MSDMRIDPKEFRGLDLEVHEFLAGVPLQDVSAIDLPGGGPGRTLLELRPFFAPEAFFAPEGMDAASGPVRFLFSLRRLLGRVFGWDRDAHDDPRESYLDRLPSELAARSLLPPGTPEGPFRVIYLLEQEALTEIRNATVHAFSAMALQPVAGGYRFYWAIWVKPVSRLTPFYMALIEPFRRFIVYPALLRRLRRAWLEAYPAANQ